MSSKNHTKNKKIFEDSVNRLLKASGCETLEELGIALGYESGNALTNWKSRGINMNRVLKKFPTIRVDYIDKGIGPPFADDSVYEKGFNQLSDRINEEGIPYNARDLLLEALEEEANRIQNDLQGLVERIRKVRKISQRDE